MALTTGQLGQSHFEVAFHFSCIYHLLINISTEDDIGTDIIKAKSYIIQLQLDK